MTLSRHGSCQRRRRVSFIAPWFSTCAGMTIDKSVLLERYSLLIGMGGELLANVALSIARPT